MKVISQLLQKLGLYERIRYSRTYEFIQSFRNPSYLASLEEDYCFYRKLFGGHKQQLIFDVGANIGDKAVVFARLSDRVVCFEPEPRLAASLRQRFRGSSNILVEAKGVSFQRGVMALHAYGHESPFNTLNQKHHDVLAPSDEPHDIINVPVTTIDAAITDHGMPDFLKVDVEGHEDAVFTGLSRVPRLLSFEANLPTFSSETCRVALHLKSLAPEIRFAVCGSGIPFDFSFPLSCEELCKLVSAQEAVPYLEVFAFNSTLPSP